jgi:DNA gyrase/topoisomerase IV subunit A
MLECYRNHCSEVIFRCIQFLHQKDDVGAHILESYEIALVKLDDFGKIFLQSTNCDIVKMELIANYLIFEFQTNVFLEARLCQLVSLEQNKIDED